MSHAGAEPARRQQSVGLTNSQLRILGYIASCGAQGCSDTKNAIAEKLGVCPKTVDRAVRRMRDDGLIVGQRVSTKTALSSATCISSELVQSNRSQLFSSRRRLSASAAFRWGHTEVGRIGR